MNTSMPARLRAAHSLVGPVAGRKLLPEHARNHNRALVLRTLQKGGQQSRADIARATGLSRVTVSDLVAELSDDTLVLEIGQREGVRSGKPATLLDIDNGAFTMIGIDLSQPSLFRGALLDLGGAILDRAESHAPDARGAAATDAVVTLIDDLAAKSPSPVLGIGIGSPGIVDGNGVVLQATNLGWRNEDLAGIVSRRFGAPTVVMNDADAAALAELAWGGGADDMVLVRVGRGVGAGVIINRQLVRGSRFAAGEIGHVVVDIGGGGQCTCGKSGCLETWLSVPALGALVAAVGDDEAAAREVYATAGERLGIVLAPVIGMLNLAEVVLNGPDDVITPELIDVTAHTIAERTITPDNHGVTIRRSNLGTDGVLRGVAAEVLASQLGLH